MLPQLPPQMLPHIVPQMLLVVILVMIQLLAQICKEHGIAVTNSVPYFHNSNMVERAHKELNQGLQMLLPSPPDGWVDALAPLLLAYNSQEHRVTIT